MTIPKGYKAITIGGVVVAVYAVHDDCNTGKCKTCKASD